MRLEDPERGIPSKAARLQGKSPDEREGLTFPNLHTEGKKNPQASSDLHCSLGTEFRFTPVTTVAMKIKELKPEARVWLSF